MRKFLAISAAVVVLTVVPGQAKTPATLQVKSGPLVSFGARESGNWAGYNLGYLSSGLRRFTQISGTWTVQTPSKHRNGVNEYSVTWVGIGGGCIDQPCLLTDTTLIQAGTASDISASGVRSYYAWWEIIPGPILRTNMTVTAGNQIKVDISLVVKKSNLWKIVIQNLSNGQTFNQTIAYSSSQLTAEWIEERPLVGAFFANLPNLTNPRFNGARVNGAPVQLTTKDQMVMVEGSTRLATPSAPDPDANGFNVCTYTTSCAAPSGA
jgi:hypothetical protein